MSTFFEYDLSESMKQTLSGLGFVTPTPIQKEAIPLLLAGTSDFIGLASTGTGKTLAFGIPLIEQIDPNLKAMQGLVLCPTRELAQQVATQLTNLGQSKKLRIAVIYGGSSYQKQIEAIKRGATIAVATPGRLKDLIEGNYLKINALKALIMDEADEMISMGFKDDLEWILSATHAQQTQQEKPNSGHASANSIRAACKTWLFSATMSREIRKVADQYLHNPAVVSIAKQGGAFELIDQIYYTVRDEDKPKAISRLLSANPEFYGLIFCQMKSEVIGLEAELHEQGFAVDSLHGDKQQREREYTLNRFRKREVKILVATDVAARGLDVPELTHVVHHSLPWDTESYVHRMGRTGRAGQAGCSICLVSPAQVRKLKNIQTQTKLVFKKGHLPTPEKLAEQKITELFARLSSFNPESKNLLAARELVRTLCEVHHDELLGYDKKEILARLIASEHPEFLEREVRSLDFLGGRIPYELDPKASGPRPGGERGDRGGGERYNGFGRNRRGDRGDSFRQGRGRDSGGRDATSRDSGGRGSAGRDTSDRNSSDRDASGRRDSNRFGGSRSGGGGGGGGGPRPPRARKPKF